MDDCIGKYYSEGMVIKKTSLMQKDVFESGKCYYEVLRVMDGTCLFLDDHLMRLRGSVRLGRLGYPLQYEAVAEAIRELIKKNILVEGNIRLVLRVNDVHPPVLYICCIPYAYPEPALYERGVITALYRKVRYDPNVKLYNSQYLKQVRKFIKSENIYEALLVDGSEHITEGSKSNVFFIEGQQIFTAPGVAVLKGITREKVLYICNKLNHKVIEEFTSIKNLKTREAVFLTGTSPKVLPVCKINDQPFAVGHPLLRAIMAAYDLMMLSDTKSRTISGR